MTDRGGDEGLAGVPTEHLEHEVTTLAAQLAAGTCRFLLVVAELDRREAWRSWGARSCADWLSRQCGLSPVTAFEQLRVARALDGLPVTTGVFGRGELSYSKVRALTRVATAGNEADLVELARTATAAQLERIIAASVTAARSAAEVAAERSLVLVEDDGAGRVRARLGGDALAVVRQAIDAAVAAQPVIDSSAEESAAEMPRAESSPSLAQRRADALVAICEAYLANPDPGARSGPARQQIVVHVDAEVVAGRAAAPVEGSGLVLHPDTARRLACDATTLALFERHGRTIGAGRRTRTISRRLRRALHRRSGGTCEWPGCDQRRNLDAHHLWHWTDGGPTELWNLANLCWTHHHAVHDLGFRVTWHDTRLRAFRPDDGGEVDPAPATRAHHPLPPAPHPHRITARWAGEPLDLACAVDGVLTRL